MSNETVKIKVSIKGEGIVLREAKVKCLDEEGIKPISEYPLVFKNGDTSEELSLNPGEYDLSHRVGTEMGKRDVSYEVKIIAEPPSWLSASKNPENFITNGSIGTGEKPFTIL